MSAGTKPGLNPYFISLSLLVTGRGINHDSNTLGATDCLAYAIERENDPAELPPLVLRAVAIFDRAAIRKATGEQA